MFYKTSFNLEHPEQKRARMMNRLKILTSTKELFDRFLPSVKSRSQFHKEQDLYRKPLQTVPGYVNRNELSLLSLRLLSSRNKNLDNFFVIKYALNE